MDRNGLEMRKQRWTGVTVDIPKDTLAALYFLKQTWATMSLTNLDLLPIWDFALPEW